jgi:hypothetical protein
MTDAEKKARIHAEELAKYIIFRKLRGGAK